MERLTSKKIILILIVIGFFVFVFNLNNPLFWDDDDWIVNNSYVHSFSSANIKNWFSKDILSGIGLSSNYYRPLLLASFAYNYAVGGVSPWSYHLTSNFFHIGAGIFLFLILLRIFKNKLIAFIASLIFIIHPVQVEAVAYISGRGDPMSVFFMLLSLFLFIKSGEAKQKIIIYIGSLVSFVLAILTRESAVIFPGLFFLFLATIYLKIDSLKKIKEAIIATLPYLLISGVYSLLRLTVLNFKNTLNFYSESNIYTENILFRIYTFGGALVEYFRMIFYPVGLHMERNLPILTSPFNLPFMLASLIVLAILFASFLFYKKKMYDHLGVWIFSWGWFFISLGPVSGIIPINALIYEHWLYLPLIGLSILVGFYIDKLFKFLASGSSQKYRTGQIIVLVILVAYGAFWGVASASRNHAWGDPIAFYEDTLRYSPDSQRMLTNLGNLYSEKGELDKSESLYRRSIEVSDTYPQPHYNLGNIYRDKGEYQKSADEYVKAIKIDPTFHYAYKNLAVMLYRHGMFDEAIKTIEDLKKITPEDPLVYFISADSYIQKKDYEKAKISVAEGLKFSVPNSDLYKQFSEMSKWLNTK